MLLESLLHEIRLYPSPMMAYMKPEKFPSISIDNVKSYTVLAKDERLVYLWRGAFGWVFDLKDYDSEKADIVPVMQVQLRDTVFGNGKQAYKLRIQEDYSRFNVASTWYMAYVKHVGSIVSDTEHLEGGYKLWKSFIRKAEQNGVKIVTANCHTGDTIAEVTSKTPQDEIWSTDSRLKDVVLVMTHAA